MTKENICKILSTQKMINVGTSGKDFPDNSVVCFSYDENCNLSGTIIQLLVVKCIARHWYSMRATITKSKCIHLTNMKIANTSFLI